MYADAREARLGLVVLNVVADIKMLAATIMLMRGIRLGAPFAEGCHVNAGYFQSLVLCWAYLLLCLFCPFPR